MCDIVYAQRLRLRPGSVGLARNSVLGVRVILRRWIGSKAPFAVGKCGKV